MTQNNLTPLDWCHCQEHWSHARMLQFSGHHTFALQWSLISQKIFFTSVQIQRNCNDWFQEEEDFEWVELLSVKFCHCHISAKHSKCQTVTTKWAQNFLQVTKVLIIMKWAIWQVITNSSKMNTSLCSPAFEQMRTRSFCATCVKHRLIMALVTIPFAITYVFPGYAIWILTFEHHAAFNRCTVFQVFTCSARHQVRKSIEIVFTYDRNVVASGMSISAWNLMCLFTSVKWVIHQWNQKWFIIGWRTVCDHIIQKCNTYVFPIMAYVDCFLISIFHFTASYDMSGFAINYARPRYIFFKKWATFLRHSWNLITL